MSMFSKATRKRAYLKLAVTGPSGAGKTFSALELAAGLVSPGGKIALLDTENESASLYSDRFDFDTCPLFPPFTPERYAEIIAGAVDAGYEILVMDSLSHEWMGEGGVLAMKESRDARGGNSFTNWAEFTPRHEKFKSAIQQSRIHIIATMRSKQEYVIEQNGAKSAPRKVGMAAVQRDGFEYEFTTVLDIAMNHEAVPSKDRTGLFDGMAEKIARKHGRMLRDWLEGGAELKEAEREETAQSVDHTLLAKAAYAKRAVELGHDVLSANGSGKPSGQRTDALFFRQTGRDAADAAAAQWEAATKTLTAPAKPEPVEPAEPAFTEKVAPAADEMADAGFVDPFDETLAVTTTNAMKGRL